MKDMDSDIEELLGVKKLEEDEIVKLINATIVKLKQQDYEIQRLTTKVAQLKNAIQALTVDDNYEENSTHTQKFLTESFEEDAQQRAHQREFDMEFNAARRNFDNFAN